MICLGIDLGVHLAFAVLREARPMPELLFVHTLEKPSGLELQRSVRGMLEQWEVNLVATERPITGKWDPRPLTYAHQREQQSLIRAVCQELGIPLVDFYPNEVKKAATGNGSASKGQVQKWASGIFGVGAENDHLADAVAIGFVGLNRERQRRLMEAQRKLVLRAKRKKSVKV